MCRKAAPGYGVLNALGGRRHYSAAEMPHHLQALLLYRRQGNKDRHSELHPPKESATHPSPPELAADQAAQSGRLQAVQGLGKHVAALHLGAGRQGQVTQLRHVTEE